MVMEVPRRVIKRLLNCCSTAIYVLVHSPNNVAQYHQREFEPNIAVKTH